MKKGKIIFTVIIALFFGATVLGKNNLFNAGFGFFGDDGSITETELRDYVNEQLVIPMKKCYAEANPHLFMTKCYSDLKVDFTGEDWTPEGEERKFYMTSNIPAEIIFVDCGMQSHICDLSINYHEKSINVKEDFFGGWEDSEDYLNTFCEKVSKASETEETK
ncbi:MAG: hypothetical protein MK078_15690 [Crocinitomicaceae bacterium]|nr:hypothetical protein [Crocinitomicaceae bacterium]